MLIQCPECHRRYEFALKIPPDNHKTKCTHCGCLIPLPGPPLNKRQPKTESLELKTSPEAEAAYRRSTRLAKSETRPAPPPVAPEPVPEPIVAPVVLPQSEVDKDSELLSEDATAANPKELEELRGLLGVPLPPGRNTSAKEFVPPPKPPPVEPEAEPLLQEAPPPKEPALEPVLEPEPPPVATTETEALAEKPEEPLMEPVLHDEPPIKEPEEPAPQGFFERALREPLPVTESSAGNSNQPPLFEEEGAVPDIPTPPSPQPTKPKVEKKVQPPTEAVAAIPSVDEVSQESENPETAEEAGVPWGRLTLVSTLATLGLLVILWTGGYLHMIDSPLLGRLVGVQMHQFEFVGNLKVEKLRNNFSRQAIYVMTGTIRSNFPDSAELSSIRLKGLAFDESQKVLESEVVYAGVLLSRQELSDWSVSRIKDEYKERYGRNELNRNLREGEELPFQVVFFEAGELFRKASAQIISYQREGRDVFVRTAED